jgi:chromosome segregation ATPase
VGEEALHEVAFLLRRNRAAAAYKASPNDAAVQAATASPETSSLAGGGQVGGTVASRELAITGGTVTGSGGGDFAATGASFRSQRTNKDDSSLMLRLMMKEREQVLPEDKLFYQQVAEHIDKLLMETSKHKQGRSDGEEREKLSTTGFMDREQRYTREIRQTEEQLQKSIADKENCQRDIAQQSMDLKRLNEENASAIRESISAQEQAMAEEQQLRKELRDIIQEKREFQDKLALGNKDLELLNQENERLRAHVKAFQRDVNEILA